MDIRVRDPSPQPGRRGSSETSFHSAKSQPLEYLAAPTANDNEPRMAHISVPTAKRRAPDDSIGNPNTKYHRVYAPIKEESLAFVDDNYRLYGVRNKEEPVNLDSNDWDDDFAAHHDYISISSSSNRQDVIRMTSKGNARSRRAQSVMLSRYMDEGPDDEISANHAEPPFTGYGVMMDDFPAELNTSQAMRPSQVQLADKSGRHPGSNATSNNASAQYRDQQSSARPPLKSTLGKLGPSILTSEPPKQTVVDQPFYDEDDSEDETSGLDIYSQSLPVSNLARPANASAVVPQSSSRTQGQTPSGASTRLPSSSGTARRGGARGPGPTRGRGARSTPALQSVGDRSAVISRQTGRRELRENSNAGLPAARTKRVESQADRLDMISRLSETDEIQRMRNRAANGVADNESGSKVTTQGPIRPVHLMTSKDTSIADLQDGSSARHDNTAPMKPPQRAPAAPMMSGALLPPPIDEFSGLHHNFPDQGTVAISHSGPSSHSSDLQATMSQRQRQRQRQRRNASMAQQIAREQQERITNPHTARDDNYKMTLASYSYQETLQHRDLAARRETMNRKRLSVAEGLRNGRALSVASFDIAPHLLPVPAPARLSLNNHNAPPENRIAWYNAHDAFSPASVAAFQITDLDRDICKWKGLTMDWNDIQNLADKKERKDHSIAELKARYKLTQLKKKGRKLGQASRHQEVQFQDEPIDYWPTVGAQTTSPGAMYAPNGGLRNDDPGVNHVHSDASDVHRFQKNAIRPSIQDGSVTGYESARSPFNIERAQPAANDEITKLGRHKARARSRKSDRWGHENQGPATQAKVVEEERRVAEKTELEKQRVQEVEERQRKEVPDTQNQESERQWVLKQKGLEKQRMRETEKQKDLERERQRLQEEEEELERQRLQKEEEELEKQRAQQRDQDMAQHQQEEEQKLERQRLDRQAAEQEAKARAIEEAAARKAEEETKEQARLAAEAAREQARLAAEAAEKAADAEAARKQAMTDERKKRNDERLRQISINKAKENIARASSSGFSFAGSAPSKDVEPVARTSWTSESDQAHMLPNLDSEEACNFPAPETTAISVPRAAPTKSRRQKSGTISEVPAGSEITATPAPKRSQQRKTPAVDEQVQPIAVPKRSHKKKPPATQAEIEELNARGFATKAGKSLIDMKTFNFWATKAQDEELAAENPDLYDFDPPELPEEILQDDLTYNMYVVKRKWWAVDDEEPFDDDTESGRTTTLGEFASVKKANAAAADELLRSSGSDQEIVLDPSKPYTIHSENSEHNLCSLQAEFPAGHVKVWVVRDLRSRYKGPLPTFDRADFVAKIVYVIREGSVTKTNNPKQGQDAGREGEEEEEEEEEEVGELLEAEEVGGVYSTLSLANSLAADRLADKTFHATARRIDEVKAQKTEYRYSFNAMLDELEERDECFWVQKEDRGGQMIRVWVEKRDLMGPRN